MADLGGNHWFPFGWFLIICSLVGAGQHFGQLKQTSGFLVMDGQTLRGEGVVRDEG